MAHWEKSGVNGGVRSGSLDDRSFCPWSGFELSLRTNRWGAYQVFWTKEMGAEKSARLPKNPRCFASRPTAT